MYTNPKEFAKQFSEWMKKQSNLWWFKADFDKFILDLDEVNHNMFNSEIWEKNKEEVLDTWRDYFEKDNSTPISSIFKWINKWISFMWDKIKNLLWQN